MLHLLMALSPLCAADYIRKGRRLVLVVRLLGRGIPLRLPLSVRPTCGFPHTLRQGCNQAHSQTCNGPIPVALVEQVELSFCSRPEHTPEHTLSQSFCACSALALCIS